jgi:CubicO group peptidase (beta-lactamase class C family)
MKWDRLDRVAQIIEPMLSAARVPGAAVAVVNREGSAWARGFGVRDMTGMQRVTPRTVYPIASTTKAMNATLIGMLVDDGRLGWDVPVKEYLPWFRLGDATTSAQTTLRDLIVMRTGLPRHDWLWIENAIDRSELTRRLAHLGLSVRLRERFQYNNLTVTVAGHIAEVVTNRSWEELLRERILDPLGMRRTGFSLPCVEDVCQSYQEAHSRDLKLVPRFAGELTAPSGGAVHSTVEDMSRWMSFNLNSGCIQDHPLIRKETLLEIHSPQVVARPDPSCPTPGATYAMGWFIDHYRGCGRLSHGGLLHYMNSSVMLFPAQGIGIVSFVNFSATRLAPIIGESVFDILMGLEPQASIDSILQRYEEQVRTNAERNASARRVPDAPPSHSLTDYQGTYTHAAYGRIDIAVDGNALVLKRGKFMLQLQHWHYDAWVGAENDLFELHGPNVFDNHSRIIFETDAEGIISAFSLRLEPAVAPIRFERN